MVEPVSILTAAGAVSRLAYSCTISLYTSISNNKIVSHNVKALYDEVEHLRQTANSVESTLQRPDLEAFQDAALWTDADTSLRSCSDLLKRFEATLQGLRSGAKPSNNFLRNAVTQVKVELRDDQIKTFRIQMHSHTLALQTLLQMINVHVASSGPQVVLKEVVPRLAMLAKSIRSLERRYGMVRGPQSSSEPSAADQDSLIVQANQKLARSALALLTEVASAIDDEARSTIFGGTEPDLDFTSMSGGVPLATIVPPPAFDPLNPVFSRIQSWKETTSEGDSKNGKEDTSDKTHTARDSLNNIQDPHLSLDLDETEINDSDDDDELDLAQKYVDLGRVAASKGEHEKAESFLRRALVKPRSLARLSDPIIEGDLKHELALVLMEQDKADDACAICEELIKLKIHSDADRYRLLDASYTLARARLLQGSLLEAEKQCHQAMSGRKRLMGRCQAYFETVALLATICKAKKDFVDAEAYTAMLPQDYKAPFFRLPIVDQPSPKKQPTLTIIPLAPDRSPTIDSRKSFPTGGAPSIKAPSTKSAKLANKFKVKFHHITTARVPSGKRHINNHATLDHTELLPSGVRLPYRTLEHASAVYSVALSPNGQLLASGSSDAKVRIWDTTSWTEVQILDFGEEDVHVVPVVAFSPDGRLLAGISPHSAIRLWSTATWKPLQSVTPQNKAWNSGTTSSMAFSPDGQYLANGTFDTNITLWSTTTWEAKQVLRGHTHHISQLTFSPNSNFIASASFDKTVRLWDATQKIWRILSGHTEAVLSVAFSRDSALLASGSGDATVRLWNVATGVMIRILEGHKSLVGSVAFSPNGQLFASGSGDGKLKLWDTTTWTCRNLDGHVFPIFSLAFYPDSQLLVSGSDDDTVKLWDLSSEASFSDDMTTARNSSYFS